MSNYKIRVNSKSESKEAQQLFFELGYEKGACSTGGYPALIIATPESRFKKTPYSSRAKSLNHEAHNQYKEITITELRDMVNPMKEYLFKYNDQYTLVELSKKDAESNPEQYIEVPEGANCAISTCSGLEFYKDNLNLFFSISGDCWKNTISKTQALSQNIVWQRHTQPEELPFIDDEPSLNDQYAEIEKVRQSHRTASETSNPTIKETLSQRQSQYGSFEDVATATQDLLKILEKTGLKSLPSMHKEALHMICSKMVRIVNGDHNFIESWHDIAGYATLMENELRVTDGATNSRLTYQKVINGKLQDI